MGAKAAAATNAPSPAVTQRRADEALRSLREAHRLAVAEALAVRVAEQRVRAPHDARVDRGHDERRGPATEVAVEADAALIRALGLLLRAPCASDPGRGRTGWPSSRRTFGIARGVLHQREHRRDGAAAELPFILPTKPLAHASEPSFLRAIPQHVDAEVERDRVEAAAVDDARVRLRRPSRGSRRSTRG